MPVLNDPAEDTTPGPGDLRSESFTWDAPDRSLLSRDFGDAPRFPTDMLGPFWSQWVTETLDAVQAEGLDGGGRTEPNLAVLIDRLATRRGSCPRQWCS